MINKSNILKVSVSFLAASFITFSYAKELKGWNIHKPEYPVSVAMDEFSKLISDRTDGKYSSRTFHSSSLGNQDEAIELIQVGAIDYAVFNLVPINNIVPATQAATLPYAFKSVEHMHRVLDGDVGEEVSKSMESANMVALAWYDSGSRSFYSSKPIKSLNDLKGLKFRVQNSDVNVAMVEALGAVAIPLPFSEVYEAIEMGVVDGAENNWPSYESTGHYKVAQNYILDQHTIVPEVFVINKSLWDSLSDHEKVIFRDSARDSALIQRKLWADKEKSSEEIVKSSGAVVTSLSDKSEFIDAMKPVYDKFAESPEVKRILDMIQSVE